jgi:nucleoside 2-deoxyribosyltransferase
MIRVYLAGDIQKYDKWRPKVIEALEGHNVKWLSPIDECSYDMEKLTKSNRENKVFLFCDYMKVDKSDIVFALIRKSKSRHSGTSAEIGYGKAKGKIIIVVNLLPKNEAYLYDFVKKTADAYFTELKDGIDFLQQFVTEMEYVPG